MILFYSSVPVSRDSVSVCTIQKPWCWRSQMVNQSLSFIIFTFCKMSKSHCREGPSFTKISLTPLPHLFVGCITVVDNKVIHQYYYNALNEIIIEITDQPALLSAYPQAENGRRCQEAQTGISFFLSHSSNHLPLSGSPFSRNQVWFKVLCWTWGPFHLFPGLPSCRFRHPSLPGQRHLDWYQCHLWRWASLGISSLLRQPQSPQAFYN